MAETMLVREGDFAALQKALDDIELRSGEDIGPDDSEWPWWIELKDQRTPYYQFIGESFIYFRACRANSKTDWMKFYNTEFRVDPDKLKASEAEIIAITQIQQFWSQSRLYKPVIVEEMMELTKLNSMLAYNLLWNSKCLRVYSSSLLKWVGKMEHVANFHNTKMF